MKFGFVKILSLTLSLLLGNMNRYSHLTDEALFSLLKEGDEELFGIIYDRHWEGVYKYMKTCVKDEDLSKDLAQDVFFSIWKKRHAVEIRSSLHDYIIRCARHRAILHFQSDGIRKKYALRISHFMKVTENSTEEQSDLSDLQQAIDLSIEELPPKCRDAFRLSRYQHLSLDEIAKQMNISKRTAENYITRALKHLHGSLGEFLFVLFWIYFYNGEG